jgi:site-specific recombinase XerD
MAYLKLNPSGKYNSICSKWNKSLKKQKQKRIDLDTHLIIEAKKRNRIVEEYELEIMAGEVVIFPWQKGGGKPLTITLKLSESINQFIDYQQNIKSLGKSTVSLNIEALNHLQNCISDIPIEVMTIQHTDQFVEYLKCIKKVNGELTTKYTVNNRIRNFNTFMNWLYEREMITKKLNASQLAVAKPKPRYITEPVFNLVMNENISERYLRMFKLHWDTGMRLSESFVGEIRGEWYTIPAERAKNHRERSIRVNAKQIETILMIQSQWAENPTVDSIKWYSKKFKKALKLVGIEDRHFHCLRHSFGVRRILETNGNIHLVRDEMGHESVVVTEKYTRFDRKEIERDFPSLSRSSKVN